MSVYKSPKSPFYTYDFQLGGIRFFGPTKCRSEREAKKYEAARRVEAKAHVENVRASHHEPMTVNVAFDRFWVEVGVSYRGNAAKTFFAALGWLMKDIGKHTLIREIGKRQISAAIARRQAEGVSSATVNRTVTEPLRRVLNRAHKRWDEPVKPIVWNDFLLAEPRERVRELRETEEVSIFEVMRADYHTIVAFAIVTGFRLAECVSLRWRDIDWAGMTVTVRGKGDVIAVIPMTVDVRDMLWQLRGHHEEQVFTYVAAATRPHRDLVKGRRYPITYEGMKTMWRRRVAKAAIEDFRFHDLRHTAATRFLRATGNLKLAQMLLRHSDIATTMKYAHANTDDLRRGMEAVTESRKNSQKREGEETQTQAS